MSTIRTKKEFLYWLKTPDSELKEKYLSCSYYRPEREMLNLKNLILNNLDIQDKHFESTEFKNCTFQDCEFTSSFIASCTLIDCAFINCSFTWCEFLESDFINVKFYQCHISDLSAADIVAKNLVFEDCYEIVDLKLRGTYANREISFADCYIEFLYIDPIEKDFTEIINFKDCIIQKSSFIEIDFNNAKFIRCSLSSNHFSGCTFSKNTFNDLNETPGNEYNYLDLRTILNSDNQPPDVLGNIFGVQHSDIKEYIFGLTSKIEFQSIFISYSFNDKAFAKRINDELINKGILTFLWEKDSPGGKTLKKIMSSGINEKDRVLFIASKYSLRSAACQYELSEGRKKQEEVWEDVLFPIHIDGYLFKVKKDDIRPKEMQDEYWGNISELKNLNSLDFSQFTDSKNEDKNSFNNQIFRLIKGLKKTK